MTFGPHMLTDSGDIEPLDDLADDGSPQYGALETGVAMRVEREIEVSAGSDGSTDDTVTRVWLDQEVGKGDRIHLPDGEVLEVMSTTTIESTDGRTQIFRAEG